MSEDQHALTQFNQARIDPIIFFYIGGHLGRDKTREKVSSRFFWKTQMKDVDEFDKTCDMMFAKAPIYGAKFIKTAAPLHPIPIQPSVWH